VKHHGTLSNLIQAEERETLLSSLVAGENIVFPFFMFSNENMLSILYEFTWHE